MNFIFNKLPTDIINHILLYDKHFSMRNGEIISIIPKRDYRYKLISFITFNLVYAEEFNNVFTYKYYFNNLYNYEG